MEGERMMDNFRLYPDDCDHDTQYDKSWFFDEDDPDDEEYSFWRTGSDLKWHCESIDEEDDHEE